VAVVGTGGSRGRAGWLAERRPSCLLLDLVRSYPSCRRLHLCRPRAAAAFFSDAAEMKATAATTTFSQSASSVPVSRADHMETSDAAVRDVATLLTTLARRCMGKGQDTAGLRLWDPYFCQGSVKKLYARYGFPRCHNEPEDFYELIRPGSGVDLPPHDVLVTNPPCES
jgi:hypothetical protein